jgi:hypothetical protein
LEDGTKAAGKVKVCSHTGRQVEGGGGERHRQAYGHHGCINKVVRRIIFLRNGDERPICGHKGYINTVILGGVCYRHGAQRPV